MEPEGEETKVDLEPLRKTYLAAAHAVKLARRWLKTKPESFIGSPDSTDYFYDTYFQVFTDDLKDYRNRYGYSPELVELIAKSRPLTDALQFLDFSISRASKVGRSPFLVVFTIDRLEAAKDILGEVLDDLEAEENPTLRPEWNREVKQLWYGETLCREYRRTAPEQFQILDLFQVREWPRTVPSPWRDEKRLRDTVGHLNDNHTQESLIRFEVFNMKPAWYRHRPRSSSR
jgi:hypothetical protein